MHFQNLLPSVKRNYRYFQLLPVRSSLQTGQASRQPLQTVTLPQNRMPSSDPDVLFKVLRAKIQLKIMFMHSITVFQPIEKNWQVTRCAALTLEKSIHTIATSKRWNVATVLIFLSIFIEFAVIEIVKDRKIPCKFHWVFLLFFDHLWNFSIGLDLPRRVAPSERGANRNEFFASFVHWWYFLVPIYASPPLNRRVALHLENKNFFQLKGRHGEYFKYSHSSRWLMLGMVFMTLWESGLAETNRFSDTSRG